ncbi:MAG: 2-oxoacid:acceptor oxidoreductase family protein, partial [Candidatus Helarchaeota archaeon]
MMKEEYNIILTGTGGQGVLLSSNILGWSALQSGYQVRAAETHGMAQRGGSVIVHLRFGKKVQSPLVKTGNADVILAFELAESLRNARYLRHDGLAIINQQISIPPIIYASQKIQLDQAKCMTGCNNCISACELSYVINPKHYFPVLPTRSPLAVINGECRLYAEYCTGCGNCIDACPQQALAFKDQEIRYPSRFQIEERFKKITSRYYIVPASYMAFKLGNIRATNVFMVGILIGTNQVPISPEIIKDNLENLIKAKFRDLNLKAFEKGMN